MLRRIVVAADLVIVRMGIVITLVHDPLLQVVAETEDGPTAVAACRELQPDLLILALRFPPSTDLAVAHLVTASRHAPRVLVLGERGDTASVHAALEAGAAGYLSATVGATELCSAVHQVLSGEKLTPVSSNPPAPTTIVLGSQERLILSKVAEGLPNKAISIQQGISVRTVGSHLQHIFRKLGASNRMEAVLRARQQGLLRNE
jgi:DNA-binding NarL/FixJ family response regulator